MVRWVGSGAEEEEEETVLFLLLTEPLLVHITSCVSMYYVISI